MSKLPSINSYDLFSALNKASPKIDKYQETLNHISSDIKAVEKYLRESGIALPYRYWISTQQNDHSVSESEFDLEISGDSLEEQLCWEEDARGEYRIIYKKVNRVNVVRNANGTELQAGEATVLESKPLIECKAAVRVAAYGCLAKFVEGLSEHIPSPTDVQEITSSDETDGLHVVQ